MALFGKDAVLGQPWQVLDPLFIALPLSVLTLATLWWLDRQATLKNGRIEDKATA
jgi:SSS family solute:Na+ symporter